MKDQRQLPPGGKQEPTLGKLLAAKGGSAEAIKRQADKVESLCAEVFRLTGQKITPDDPIVLAALFQSELVNKASENAAALFQDAVVTAIAQLTEAVKTEREHAANLDKSVATAFQQIADGTKKAGDQELVTMQGKFSRMASETLDQVRRESARRAPGGMWWKFTAVLCSGLIAGLIGGIVLGKGMAPKLSDDQVRLMHNGLLLDDAWPKMSKATREAFGAAPKASDPHVDDKSASKPGKK